LVIQFKQINLDTTQYRLCVSGNPISVEPQVFDLLVYLVENRDRVVTRDELLDNLWKGKVVTDAALSVTLRFARKAVGDSGRAQNIIKTIHGRGYQFIAEVTEAASPSSPTFINEVIDSSDFLSLPDKPSIAVLPFTNMSDDPDQEYFCDGITDDIITILSRVPDMFVIARHSTQLYKGRAIDIRQVGREQGVGYVLEGGVQKRGGRIRVSVQLIDSVTGRHCWAERVDSDLNDILDLQDEITRNIVVSLQVTLTEGVQARMFAGSTSNLEAWESARLAKRLMERHIREDNLEAQQLLIKAIEHDPQYATAWAYLGWTQWENDRWNWVNIDETSLDKARESVSKSLQLDESNPDGLALLGMIHMTCGKLEEGIQVTEDGVAANPSHAFLLAISACILRAAGKTEVALRRILRAIRLCPMFPSWYLMVLGSLHIFNQDNSGAVKILREAVSREPDSILSRIWLISAQVESGLIDDSKKTASDALRIEPEFSSLKWIRSVGFQDSETLSRLLSNLTKAGLPE
jgi:TolB-like protein